MGISMPVRRCKIYKMPQVNEVYIWKIAFKSCIPTGQITCFNVMNLTTIKAPIR